MTLPIRRPTGHWSGPAFTGSALTRAPAPAAQRLCVRRRAACMPRVVVTGGPGVGKTTLLAQLHASGYTIVSESARAIISERRRRGQSPRPEPAEFARE